MHDNTTCLSELSGHILWIEDHDKGTSPYIVQLCPSHGISVNYVPGELPLEGLHSRYHCQ